MHTPSTFGGDACLTLGYAGCRGNTPQPVPMVQCSCAGEKERWITVLLHRFLQA